MEFLKMLLMLSVGGSVLAGALLLARRLLGRKLPSTFFYYAWLVVLLRLIVPLPGMLPVTAAVPAPVADAIPVTSNPPIQQEPWYDAEGERAEGERVETATNQRKTSRPADTAVQLESSPVQTEPRRWKTESVLLLLWAVGAAISFGWYGICYARFVCLLRRSGSDAKAQEWDLLEKLCADGPELMRSADVKTPMLVGTLHPVVVLPEREYEDEMLENIFRHELTHYRRGDILYKWFAVAVYCVHWFNPMMAVIRSAHSQDCEMSCDEVLLRSMSTAEKKSYGETLLTLAAERALPGRLVATTFATEKKNLKERLEQIMTYRKMGKAAFVLLLSAVLLLCGCAATVGPASAAEPTRIAATEPTQLAVTEPILETTVTRQREVDAASSSAKQVRVTNVNELLNAIGPDREIILAPGTYNLTEAENYSRVGSAWYHWEACYDGYELIITDVANMTIRGEGSEGVEITTRPRYANVLRFESASGIALRNLTVGHTEEPSACCGGVLYYDNCSDLEVVNARLYGCGTLGVDLYNSQNFHMDRSDIYQCSYGAAYVEKSYNVLFENSKFYDCHVWQGILEVVNSQEVALINSEIFNNSGDEWSSLFNVNCTGVYLGGLDIHDNTIGHFLNSYMPVTMESCRLGYMSYMGGFYNGNSVLVDKNGAELTSRDFATMTMRTVQWTAAPIIQMVAPEKGDDGKIRVSNVDQFLAAIDSNTTIYLEPGVYDLSTAANYGSLGGKSYYWQNDYDGPGLVIFGVSNLTIEGAGKDLVSIVAVPRYANVMLLETVEGVTLKNFTAGHSTAPGTCSGGVIAMNSAVNVRVEGCGLFGCGIVGISASSCQNIQVVNTEIYDCSDGAVKFFNSQGVRMEGCNVHDCGTPLYYADSNCDVTIDGRTLEGVRLMRAPEDVPEQGLEMEVSVGEDGKYHVSNADEFLAAIGPDRTIYLEAGYYDLFASATYGTRGNNYYRWEEVYDGYELVIFGTNNLILEGAGKDEVWILAEPRYADVLRFEKLSNLILRGFTAGHIEEPGHCTGNVISLNGVTTTNIEGCGLFGCGILGVRGVDCQNLYIIGTEIYGCSSGAAQFFSCTNVRVDYCDIHDNDGEDFYVDYRCKDVKVDGKALDSSY